MSISKCTRFLLITHHSLLITFLSKETMRLIKPHGGSLVNREVTGQERERLIEASREMPALRLNAREISDLEMIGTGAYSPLEGFMDRADYHSVCANMRLAGGVAWPMPVTLSLTNEQAGTLRQFQDVALYQEDHLLGVLHLADMYAYDKAREAELVYRTTDAAHPGVRALYSQGDWLLGERSASSTGRTISRSRSIAGIRRKPAPFFKSVVGDE